MCGTDTSNHMVGLYGGQITGLRAPGWGRRGGGVPMSHDVFKKCRKSVIIILKSNLHVSCRILKKCSGHTSL